MLEGAVLPLPDNVPNQLVPQVPIADLPMVVSSQLETSEASISAKSFVVIDRDSAAVLFEKAATQPQYPASTLKLLTALVVLDHWQPTETVTLTQADLLINSESVNTLEWQVGEIVSIHDLLASLLINSDNLSGFILANHYPGGLPGLMAAMQARVTQLGLTQTRLANPVGLDAPGQQLTAVDLAILARAVLAQPVLAELVQQKTYTVTDWRQGLVVKHFLANTNQLLWSKWQVKGIKTGTTELAGEVLVSVVTIKGHDLIVVVMGSQDRYLDTQRLLTEITARYRWQTWTEFLSE